MKLASLLFVAGILGIAYAGYGQTSNDGPYKVLQTVKVGGEGGFDYIDCDPDTRHLYIVRSGGGRGGGGGAGAALGRISVYDMDTLKLIGEIPDVQGGHGVAVDPKSGHAVSSSRPPVVFDTKTLAKISSVDGVQGGPDGILYEPFTQKVYILSHGAPNVTVIDPVEGKVVGTIDLAGAPEQGCSDGKGHVYIDVEDQANVAVVDAKTMTCTGHYELQGKGSNPAGLALDPDNGIIFSYCHSPNVCVIMSAADGKILDVLPTGNGVDAAEFNPATKEAFSSHGGGTGELTVIKENSPTSFIVEQKVVTKPGAKCSTLDTKTGNIYLDMAERAAAPAAAAAPATPPTQPAGDQAAGGRRGRGRGGRGGGGAAVPGSFTIIVVGTGK